MDVERGESGADEEAGAALLLLDQLCVQRAQDFDDAILSAGRRLGGPAVLLAEGVACQRNRGWPRWVNGEGPVVWGEAWCSKKCRKAR